MASAQQVVGRYTPRHEGCSERSRRELGSPDLLCRHPTGAGARLGSSSRPAANSVISGDVEPPLGRLRHMPRRARRAGSGAYSGVNAPTQPARSAQVVAALTQVDGLLEAPSRRAVSGSARGTAARAGRRWSTGTARCLAEDQWRRPPVALVESGHDTARRCTHRAALGCRPHAGYVADQLGHAEAGFTYSRYRKAMQRRGGERERLEALFEGEPVVLSDPPAAAVPVA